MSKFLVTGTAGFIGFHMANALLEKGEEVVGLDNINDYYDVNLKYARLNEAGISREDVGWQKVVQSARYPAYRFIRMNLEDKAGMMELFRDEKFDYVIHLAAQAGVRYSIDHPDVYIQSNITGFFNILEACRHFPVKYLLYASSSSVYGNNEKVPFSEEDNVDHPVSLYAATKKSNELMASTYSHLYGVKVTGLRFFTVYGPWGRPDMAIWKFTDAMLDDRPIEVYARGKLKRDFTYIDDIISGVLSVIKQIRVEKAPALMNIGNNSPVSVCVLINELETALKRKAIIQNLPMQPGDVKVTFADVDLLKRYSGFNLQFDLTSGLHSFINWFTKYKRIAGIVNDV